MEESKTNLKKLTPEQREEFLNALSQSNELLNIQALVAENRARIKKANLEEMIYALKLDELKTPKENGKDQTS